MKKRSGFTLIEILIVIMIVGILTIVAIGSFGVTRQRAKMELISDTLVTTIKQQQNLAKSGRGGDKPLCYGLYFDMEAKDSNVKIVTSPYFSVDLGAEKADYCDTKSLSTTKEPLAVLENFKMTGIDAYGKPVNSYVIMFRPPEANISVGESLDNNLTILQGNSGLNVSASDSELKVTIESPDKVEKRQIIFDVSTGRVKKITPVETASNAK